MKKNIVIPVMTVLAAGALLFGTTNVLAQTDDTQTFVQKLAQKLGIEESKVKTAVDELHKEKQAEMQKKIEERLAQAVSDGKITESQKTAILAKHKEMQEKRESMKDSFKDLTPEERKSAMEKEKEELKSWAEENNIDFELFMPFGHRGMGWRMKMMH